MTWQQIISSLFPWLEGATVRLEALGAKLPRLPRRWVLPLSALVLLAIACLMRCLHLFYAGYYYIMSPDSYFFDWVSRGVLASSPPAARPGAEAVYTLHSGLVYPLAYLAKGARAVFGLAPADALALVDKFLPPVIGVVTMFLIYLFAAKICNRRVAMFSALAWAVMLLSVFIGSAGYLDRDGLSLLLLTVGAFLFYLSGIWQIKVRGIDLGWLIGGVGVLVTEGLLYIEWSFAGPVLLLAVVASYCVGRFLFEYYELAETKPDMRQRLAASIIKVNWRAFALIVVANAFVAGWNFHLVGSWYHTAITIVQGGVTSTISEERGLGVGDLIGYQLFLIPMVVGLYLAFKKRAESSIFFCCWFIILFILAIFARRILTYAAPAASLLSGVGLAFLWDWVKQGQLRMLKWIGMTALGVLAVLFSFLLAYSLPAQFAVSPDRGWQDALMYLREETPTDSAVMSQWTWGYWILDQGQRRPVVDNGYYGYNAESLRDVGLAYYTTDPAEVAQLMRKYGAEYLVFSELDLKTAPTIMGWANVGQGLANFPGDSLVVRSLNGEFESGGGLKVVYRSPPEPNSTSPSEPEVVILGLTQSGAP